MYHSSVIFWFSGTGNSLYAAKRLSAELENLPLVHITDKVPESAVGGEGEKVGFVFPSYYGNLPRAVRAFVEKLDIKPGTYIFAVVTMGGAGQGSVGVLEKVLANKSLRLDYGKGVMMPANYVLMYNPADPSKSKKKKDKLDKHLRAIASEIETGNQSVRKMPITTNKLYQSVEALDASFTVNNDCKGCGLCKKICPVSNISMTNGKPTWLHHCEHCVACISWCPARAIDYGNRTRQRRRYHNVNISVEELIQSCE